MQFNRTHVVIRERKVLEVFDTALRLLQRYPVPIFITFMVPAAVFSLANYLLLKPLIDFGYEQPEGWSFFTLFCYVCILQTVTIIQSQAASAWMVNYLGNAVFDASPKYSSTFWETLKATGTLFWVHGILRGVIFTWLVLLMAWAAQTSESYIGISLGFLSLVAFWTFFVQIARPYITEVVVLEKNPVRSKSADTVSLGNRSSSLHNGNAGNAFLQMLLSNFFGGILSYMCFVTFFIARGLFINNWDFDYVVLAVLLPASLWCAQIFVAGSRFLFYLDTRIRVEGWEVELRLRAESQRLSQELTA
jgi:hypothetical protein